MSTIEALTKWNDGVIEMEKKNFSNALDIFQSCSELSAKLLFNCAMCNFVNSNFESALNNMKAAMVKDEHLAIGYHFRGILYFKTAKYEEAVKDFETAHKKLRGKNVIDYNQLGCRYKFYAFEPLYNCGVSWACLQSRPKALDFLLQAQKCKVEKKHEVVEQTILKVDKDERTDIIVLPVEAIFRPPKSKLANIKKKDYLGKAKVISAVDTSDTSPGFEAPRKLSVGILTVPVDKTQSRSAPSSPRLRKKHGSASDQTQDSNSLGVPLLMTSSHSASDLQKLDSVSKSRKALPPPPDKSIPVPPGKSERPSKPLPEAPAKSERPSKPLPEAPAKSERPSKPLPEAPAKSERPSKPLPEAPAKSERPSKPLPEAPAKSERPSKPQPEAPAKSERPSKPLPEAPAKYERPSKPLPDAPAKSERPHKALPELPPRVTSQSQDQNGSRKDLPPPPDKKVPPAPSKLHTETSGRRTKPLPVPPTVITDTDSAQTSEGEESEQLTVAQRVHKLKQIGNITESGEKREAKLPPKPRRMEAVAVGSAAPLLPSRDHTNTAPLPPKPKMLNKAPGREKVNVSVEITCNHTAAFTVTKGAALDELLQLACDEFVLEPGTVDLWYKGGEEEYTCIENEDEMTRVWAAVKDKLSLFCFSKQ